MVATKTIKHRGSPEYNAWKAIKQRCYNTRSKNYPMWGGRGIVVCDRWRDDFFAFLADMGERPSKKHSIERKDNNGPYAPDNCVWATKFEQGANKRNNRLLTYNGETLHLNEWARRCGIPRLTLRRRLFTLGWAIELALTTPVEITTRRPGLRLLTYQGETRHVSDWCRRFGMTSGCVTHRLKKGWTVEAALTTPAK